MSEKPLNKKERKKEKAKEKALLESNNLTKSNKEIK